MCEGGGGGGQLMSCCRRASEGESVYNHKEAAMTGPSHAGAIYLPRAGVGGYGSVPAF